jgi:hypothetical protein
LCIVWNNISESEPLINGIWSILIDPSDNQHIIVLSGSQTIHNINEYGHGIFETFDHGANWQKVPTETSWGTIFSDIGWEHWPVKLVSHPSSFEDLYLVTRKGLYRRQYSYQQYWSPVFETTDIGEPVSDIVFDKNNPNTFYLGGHKIFEGTVNGGVINYTDITSSVIGPVTDKVVHCLLGTNGAYPNNIWFYFRTDTKHNHITKLSGGTFNYLDGHSDPNAHRTLKINPSLQDPDVAYLGGIQMEKFTINPSPPHSRDIISTISLDTGVLVLDNTDYLHADIRDMELHEVDGSERVYVAHDGGVAWGEYNGGSCNDGSDEQYCWHQISDLPDVSGQYNSGLYNNEFYGISISKSDPLIIAGGTQDCSSFIWQEETDSWQHVAYSDGLESCVSPMNSNKVIIGEGVSGTYRYYVYDLNTKENFHLKTSSGDLDNNIIHHTRKDNTIFIGCDKLYEIDEAFSNSFNINEISIPAAIDKGISALSVGFRNPEIIYIAERIDNQWGTGTGDHMWRWEPSSSSWVDISENLSYYNVSHVTDIKINPLNDMEVWICMGQAINGSNKVFHSTDGGINWSSLSTGYPDRIPAHRLVHDFTTSKLYVATDVGVFEWDLKDATPQWQELPGTRRFKLVTDLEIDYLNHRLIAGTYGRGIWISDLSSEDCYVGNSVTITSDYTYTSDFHNICTDMVVTNNATLTVHSDLKFAPGATLTIETGSTLIVDGGSITNANIILESNTTFNMINDGIILLNSADQLQSSTSTLMNLNHGTISTISSFIR